MKTTRPSFVTRHAGIVRVIVGTALILTVPLVAMQFTDEVDWDIADFLIIGILLLVAGTTFELILRKVKNVHHRITLGVILLLVVLYVWAELAVGIFTNWGS